MLDLQRQYPPMRQACGRPSTCRPRKTGSIGSSNWMKFGSPDWTSSILQCLNARERAEYQLLRGEVQGNLEGTNSGTQAAGRNPPLLPFRGTVQELERRGGRGDTPDWRTTAGKLADLANAVKTAREHLPKAADKKVTAAAALHAAATVRALQEVLKHWYAFYDGYQPDFGWWVKKPYNEAAKQLEDYAKQLRGDR